MDYSPSSRDLVYGRPSGTLLAPRRPIVYASCNSRRESAQHSPAATELASVAKLKTTEMQAIRSRQDVMFRSPVISLYRSAGPRRMLGGLASRIAAGPYGSSPKGCCVEPPFAHTCGGTSTAIIMRRNVAAQIPI